MLRNADLIPGQTYALTHRTTERVVFLQLITEQSCPGRYAKRPYVRFADGREGTVAARRLVRVEAPEATTDYIAEWRAIFLGNADALIVESAEINATQTLADEGVRFTHYSEALADERWCKIAYLSYSSLTGA